MMLTVSLDASLRVDMQGRVPPTRFTVRAHAELHHSTSRITLPGCACAARSAVLFPLVVTVYVTWWFLTFFDNFFSVRLRLAMLRP